MKAYDVLAHTTSDGEIFCIECIFPDEHDDKYHPVFADAEVDSPMFCDNCHDYIDLVLTQDGIDYVLNGLVLKIQMGQPICDDFIDIAKDHLNVSLDEFLSYFNKTRKEVKDD